MTQEERWRIQYEQMMNFMNTWHRRPSKHRLEEHNMLNWLKHVKKQAAKGKLPAERARQFAHLMETADKYRRVNQYAGKYPQTE